MSPHLFAFNTYTQVLPLTSHITTTKCASRSYCRAQPTIVVSLQCFFSRSLESRSIRRRQIVDLSTMHLDTSCSYTPPHSRINLNKGNINRAPHPLHLPFGGEINGQFARTSVLSCAAKCDPYRFR